MFAAIAVLLAACGAASSSTATRTPTAVPATPTPSGPDLTIFRGFIYPVPGGCLPKSDNLMPNAPRAYRSGVHEGVDMYGVDNCTRIEKGTPIVAAKDGVVIRADTGYHDLTQSELDSAMQRIAAGGANDFDVVDLFRGRQVWIDHGNGIVTRYAHTGGIAAGIEVGTKVVQGQVIAFVGESGTPESLSNPGSAMHAHFELRVGDSYLGKDAPPDEVRAMYEKLFEPLP